MGELEGARSITRFVFSESESSTSAGCNTTLLDLDDDLLLHILNRLRDAPAIASCGAVNTRLHRLHFFIRGICATIKSRSIKSRSVVGVAPERQYTEEHLRALLKSLTGKGGGNLQELSVSFSDQISQLGGTYYLMAAELDWIKLISSSIQSLRLRLVLALNQPSGLFANLARCTNLVTLKLFCGMRVMISGQLLALITASCKKLKTLDILEAFSPEGEPLELASRSLEDLALMLHTGNMSFLQELPSFTLDTPALTVLVTCLNVNKLHLRSHKLRSLSMESLKELKLGSPLDKLECLSCGENWSVAAVEQVLRSSTTHFLKKLEISDKAVPVANLAKIIPRHLREVEQLCIPLQGRAPGVCGTHLAQALWVKVGEIMVMATNNDEIDNEQYDLVYNSVVLLERSFPGVKKIKLAKRGSQERHEAMKQAERDLKREFPDKIFNGA